MNTITINTSNEDGTLQSAITYTETEILGFIKKAKDASDDKESITKSYQSMATELRSIRNEIRDFFSEGEWSDGETVVNKGDVNAMLERIGSHKLTTKYRGTFTVTGTFELDAEDEDEIDSVITDNLSVECYAADIDVDTIEVLDVEETE
jgi:DNA repair ATPase RecN